MFLKPPINYVMIISEQMFGGGFMLKQENYILNCPDCGTEVECKLWNSVNSILNPKQVQEILNGEFGKVVCDNCGSINYLQYPFLYHDPIHHFFISVDSDFTDALPSTSKAPLPGYRYRQVTDYTELAEKIRIFSDELDDIVIELVKNIIRTNASEKTGQILYWCKDDFLFFVTEDKDFPVWVSTEVYNNEVKRVNTSFISGENRIFRRIDEKFIELLKKGRRINE